ncbi:hypothetical protein [Spirosoma sp. KNUC1025]|uniref:hypothetical protein n=1 Tax=Spirosoma sp. KNUC1025 TaxID=2894082 RepID=UPI003864DD01|nr:hypothetical protein LN737_09410 [Spirosoma sp. KNUC1025]
MIKVLIAALFVATTSLAQTPSPPKKGLNSQAMSSSATSTTMTKAMAANAKKKGPLPEPTQKEKLESGDRAIPSYKQEKDAGVHKGRNRYTPRRTKSGARKDTTKKVEL